MTEEFEFQRMTDKSTKGETASPVEDFFSPQPAKTPGDLITRLTFLNSEISSAMGKLREDLKTVLSCIGRVQYRSFEEASIVAKAIQHTLSRLEAGLGCPNENCSEVSKLRCRQPRGMQFSFQFEHPGQDGKSTNHWGKPLIPFAVVMPRPNEDTKFSRMYTELLKLTPQSKD